MPESKAGIRADGWVILRVRHARLVADVMHEAAVAVQA